MQDRTTLIIAHRLTTMKRADRIVVLDDGKVMEAGRPDELLQRGGLHARLANLQLVASKTALS